MAAKVEMVEEGNETREYVFYEEFVPLDLQEEEVVAETADSQEVVIEEAESEEIVHATNSILPEGYDVVEEQWSGQEVIVESTDGGETTYAVKVEPASEEPEEETTTIVGSQDHVYECYKCAKRFNLKEKLYKHMKLHNARGDDVMIERDGKRIWTCTQCDKTFISRKGSIIHQRTHTGERPYSCSVCQKRFIDSSTLMKHQVIHQAVRPFSCLICRRGFNQKVALQRHEKTHGQVQPSYKCKFCPKTFLVGSSLQAHEKIHSGIKPYTCQYCPSRFHTSTAQRQHERVHTNERPYRCSYCPKAFKDSGTLFKHQVIHSGIRPFVCPICSQGFTQKVALRKHIRSHVSRNQDNVCEVCDAQYFSKDDLCTHIEEHFVQHPSLTQVKIIATSSLRNKHELMNSTDSAESPPGQGSKSPQGERGQSDLSDLATLCDVAISTAGDLANNFPCLHCGMNFRRKKSLDAHLAIHRMSCRFCDRTFPDKQSLENHERRLCLNNASGNARPVYETSSQNSSSPNVAVSNSLVGSTVANNNNQTGKHAKRFFYCERCDKTFSSRNGYIIHQRSHTGERPYPCRWCEKAFGDSATRHKHERIHTGERPFKCARCPRAFNQRAALRAHQVTHTVDRAFLCKYCPSSFPYYATLKRHQQSCHASMSCPLCGMSAPDNKLYQHVQTKHASESDLACSLCDSGVFAEVEEFTEHIIWHAKQSVMTTDKTPSEVNMSDHVVNHEIIETTEDDTQPNTVVETAIVTVSRQTKTGEETRRIPITVHNIKEEIVEEEEVIEEYTEEIEGLGETEEYIEEAYAEENYDDTSGGGVEQMVEEEAEQVSHTEEIYEEEVEDDGVLEQQLMELGQDVEIEAEIETETVEEEEEMEIESCNQLIVPKEEIIEQTIVTDEFTIVEEAYTCEICGSFFQDPQDLNDHMAAHEDE